MGSALSTPLALLALLGTPGALAAPSAPHPAGPRVRMARPVSSPGEARRIAERATGGLAVAARQGPLNGATSGWRVDVHMPGEDRGWRVTIDSDTRQVHTRTRIPNPRPPRAR
jgi:hypothetical protein